MDSALDILRRNLQCGISQSLVTMPVLTPCNHLFDYVNILNWLSTSEDCPICRQRVLINDLNYCPYLLKIIDDLHLSDENSRSVGTEMEASEPEPALGEDMVQYVSAQTTPFLMVCDVDYQPGVQVIDDIVSTGRLVDFQEDIYNPNSMTKRIDPVVERFNMNFIRRWVLPGFTPKHIYGVIRKYFYQSRNDSLAGVAKKLAIEGYYIYDIFLVRSHGPVHHYCLYSLDKKIDATTNPLPLFI